ncbi:MAG: serine hydrolase domain-containing protein [Planctomycetota bacterium]
MPAALVHVALLAAALQSPEDLDPVLGEAIDAWAAPAVEAGHLSGSLLVAIGPDVLVERHWGLANREHRVPNGPKTRYCIASISKPMTGVITARLIARGDLALTSTLDSFAPEFPRGDEITVSMLLNHTAGIPHRPLDEPLRYVPRTAAEVLAAAAAKPLLFDPGTQENYSTGGYSVLARVLEIAGGADYATLVQREICVPAGMASTCHPSDRQVVPNRATSYVFTPRGMQHAALQDTSYLVGGGSLYSSPADIHVFARTLLDGGYGDAVTAAYAREDGYRWNGITDGFRAFADHYPAEDAHVVWCGNVHSGATDALRLVVPAILRGEEFPPVSVPTPAATPVPVETLRRIEGVYELRPGSEVSVRAYEGGLAVNDWLLVPESESAFFSPQDYGRVTLRVDDEGSVVGLDWVTGETTTVMPRVRELDAR